MRGQDAAAIERSHRSLPTLPNWAPELGADDLRRPAVPPHPRPFQLGIALSSPRHLYRAVPLRWSTAEEDHRQDAAGR